MRYVHAADQYFGSEKVCLISRIVHVERASLYQKLWKHQQSEVLSRPCTLQHISTHQHWDC